MSEHATLERRRQAIYGWLLLSPALVLLSAFAFYPSIATLWTSLFSRGTRRKPVEYVGLENYTDLFADPTFWLVVKNNLIYAGVTIPVSMGIALAMALWANGKIRARGFVRTAYFTPTVLPMIAAANLWLFFYTPGLGVLDQIGSLFGLPSVNWLGQPETALWAIIIVTIWKEAGFFMIFYLAALQTIPEDLKEAADIEGASRWTYTRRIVLPLLMPTTVFIAVNALINSVKLIDHLFILTKGGPSDASKLLLYYIWEMAFAFFDAPSAAAMTIMVIVVLAIVAAIKFSYLDKRTHYQ
ncbi:sugar ABC transporter permease [Roseobacter denitrificans]|uniref:Glycerol-3-phosphate ABC transporter, permease protein, putative n=1 Tax=Roseobacter denitrificans (strain ATCC 33942 / OCh 114) TaxID=375451 RepID=Q162P3_ROSDO|nr:sugar ABC transporter permease [Roseobacter denitrificans]ABG33050.1 glycerol-3-phosphate ABC transporter, permease protein, putative [Roseobacter denitrificans OCh 114]AVL52425.1 sugar ABC transporter permease [Roseobacter denitrificans]SFG08841.1 carbohydrate ABC transporter membrane protein 1, CUT1 family [Roseobacter denitrificans OCh 114]